VSYEVRILPTAGKAIDSLPKSDRRRVLLRILSLREEPRPHGCQKLRGFEDVYRVRTGDYRIVYRIADRELLVLIVRVGHRREVYR